VLGLGFVLGLRHALDVDHLAAVTTIVSQRKSVLSSSLVGALWGLGHTAALFVVALAMVVLRARIPAAVAPWLEMGVAVMLVGLGANLLRTLWTGGHLHVHAHAHGEHPHVHPHVHPPGVAEHAHGPSRAKPFLVGVVHGLAGSAALMLAVLATLPSRGLALAYVATFGVGSVGGMVAMSTLLGVPMALAADRFAHWERALATCAGLASLVIGLVLAWEIGTAGS
jgi:high-affinity nickel permease